MRREGKINSFGFINVDKPSGIVSSTVVNKIKWLSGVPCGHMGTLDPLASGVLPVGIGNATRLFDYFLEKKKEYVAEFTFGVSSDTLDSTGELVFGGPESVKSCNFYLITGIRRPCDAGESCTVRKDGAQSRRKPASIKKLEK